ncbi:hypothetical protein D3C87_2062450 [compost metagenome]
MMSAFWSMLNRMLFEGIATAFLSLACSSMSSAWIFGMKMSRAVLPSTWRFSSNRASIFKRCDLPEPKKPETHTPLAPW